MHKPCEITILQKYNDILSNLFAHRSAVLAIAVALVAIIVVAIRVPVTESAHQCLASQCSYYRIQRTSASVGVTVKSTKTLSCFN